MPAESTSTRRSSPWRTPAVISCLSIVVNAIGNWLVINRLGGGHAGLAAVTSLVALLNFAILMVLLRRRIGVFAGLGSAVIRLALASLAVGVACIVVRAGVASVVPVDRVAGRALVAGLAVPIAAAVFGGVAGALGVREVDDVVQRLRARTSRVAR